MRAAALPVSGALMLGLAFSGWAAAPSEMTGVVVDHVTGAPIEGAYVLAAYHEKVAGPAAVKQWCVRTKGMTTAADGKFRFPVDRLDGLSPAWVDAIKPGYYQETVDLPSESVWRRQDASSYAGRTIRLSRQIPGAPKFLVSEDAYCFRAKTSADAGAGVEYLKIQLSDMTTLEADPRQLKAVRDMIARLQKLDSAPKVYQ